MNKQPLAGPLQLDQHRPHRLAHARNWLLTGLNGLVWITTTGVADDIFLAPGDSYRIPNGGLVLIESIRDGAVRLTPPQ